ncbi:hypothetical protein Ciccas_001794 [Cichlidogyrus casuarinus]|uniref:Uncharacterized protein n=1 Tax=Cichlidogyrus casuarinus TaxID=1844966 RepID=A0ABD2QJ30_9PLAT
MAIAKWSNDLRGRSSTHPRLQEACHELDTGVERNQALLALYQEVSIFLDQVPQLEIDLNVNLTRLAHNRPDLVDRDMLTRAAEVQSLAEHLGKRLEQQLKQTSSPGSIHSLQTVIKAIETTKSDLRDAAKYLDDTYQRTRASKKPDEPQSSSLDDELYIIAEQVNLTASCPPNSYRTLDEAELRINTIEAKVTKLQAEDSNTSSRIVDSLSRVLTELKSEFVKTRKVLDSNEDRREGNEFIAQLTAAEQTLVNLVNGNAVSETNLQELCKRIKELKSKFDGGMRHKVADPAEVDTHLYHLEYSTDRLWQMLNFQRRLSQYIRHMETFKARFLNLQKNGGELLHSLHMRCVTDKRAQLLLAACFFF